MKLLFFSDSHCAIVNPASRIDNYPAALLGKMEQVVQIAKAEDVAAVLNGGDTYHTGLMNWEYQNKLIEIYRRFHCEVWGVLGNHDIRFARTDSGSARPIGNLFSSGAMRSLTGEWVRLGCGKVAVTGMDFRLKPWESVPALVTEDDDGNKWTGGTRILVAHQYWGDAVPWADEETLRPEHVMGYDLVLLGHDHTPHDPVVVGKTTVIRPGSLSRGTQTGSAMDRQVFVAVVDTDKRDIRYVPLKVRPAAEIYNAAVPERKQAGKDMKEFAEQLGREFDSPAVVVEKALQEITQEEPVRERVREYCRRQGAL